MADPDVVQGYVCLHCGNYVLGQNWCGECGAARAKKAEEEKVEPPKEEPPHWNNPWTGK